MKLSASPAHQRLMNLRADWRSFPPKVRKDSVTMPDLQGLPCLRPESSEPRHCTSGANILENGRQRLSLRHARTRRLLKYGFVVHNPREKYKQARGDHLGIALLHKLPGSVSQVPVRENTFGFAVAQRDPRRTHGAIPLQGPGACEH